jgi:periplasmic protein CpxP/Spy
MKKLFIAAMLFIGVASFAQDTDQKPEREHKEKLTPEQRNEKQLQKLTTELSLDASQQAQVKQLLTERSAKAESFKEARKAKKENNEKLTAEEKAAFKKQMEDEVAVNDAKMKSILKADQYTKWKSLQEQKREKMREKIKEYKKENN